MDSLKSKRIYRKKRTHTLMYEQHIISKLYLVIHLFTTHCKYILTKSVSLRIHHMHVQLYFTVFSSLDISSRSR